MIPNKTDKDITIGGIDNTVQFTISASGKAFRTLIDGLYSDKVLAPVRELITNAADAHVAGGNPDPFKVIVPTLLDPTFGVRDYGTGMDHDTVVGLYTTLFASSKDQSNDQTGMLGLGSKSPFAYTDSFTVEAFDGVSKRIYMAYIQNDVPSLSMVGEVPCDEERGLCVKFPVQTMHTRTFTEAVYKVLQGLDTLPELDGVDLDPDRLPKVMRSGNGWRLIKGIDKPMVRQGGVLYPLKGEVFTTQGGFPDRADYMYGANFIIDVPIGTANVTASREALSYDDGVTTANLKAAVIAAWEDFQAQLLADYALCSSQKEHMDWLISIPDQLRKVEGVPRTILQGQYDLFPTHFKAASELTQDEMVWANAHPAEFPQTVKEQRPQLKLGADRVTGITFVLDDGVSPRRRSRMIKWADNGGAYNRLFIPAGPRQQATVKRLKALMGLSDEQFIPVSELHDPGPPPRSARKVIKKADVMAEVSDGKLWVERNYSTIYYRDAAGHLLATNFISEFDDEVCVDKEEVLFLSKGQVASLGDSLNWEESLSAHLMKKAEEWALLMAQDQDWSNLERSLEDRGCTAARTLLGHLGYTRPTIGYSPRLDFRLARQHELSAKYKMTTEQITAEAEAAAKKYPALFPKVLDHSEVVDYIQQQDNIQSNNQEATS